MTTEPDTWSIQRDGGYVTIRLPFTAVHGLRVALRPIRVGEATSSATQAIRDRFDKGLAIVEARK